MGEIRKENLHQSLIEHLNGLGLNEEQVNAIVQEALANVNAKDLSQDEAIGIIQSAVNKAQGEVDAVELEVDALQEFVNGHSHVTIEQNITNLQNAVSGKAATTVTDDLQRQISASQLVKTTADSGTCMNIPNNNANDITVTGCWMGANVVNGPSGVTGQWIYLESFVHNDLYQMQRATDLHNSSIQWVRHKTSGTWSSWVCL